MYHKQFAAMVDELRRHKLVVVTAAHLGGPARAADLEEAHRVLGPLPDDLLALYSEMDGFHLEWEAINNSAEQRPTRGSVEILPIREVARDWRGVTWFDDTADPYRPVRPFDFFAPEACAALIALNGSGVVGTVHYHYLGEFLCNTGYSVAAFVDRLLVARGFWYWVEALCAQTREGPEARAFLEVMPSLFDDFEPSLFVPGH